jgi:hypothetical protein
LQIRVAVVAVAGVLVARVVLAVLGFAACGGLNKENNDELCTYQQQFG